MFSDSVIEIPDIVGIGTTQQRSPQRRAGRWPAGTVIVSADSHFLEGDIWYDRFPPELRDKAPRMVFQNGGWEMLVDGKSSTVFAEAQKFCELVDCLPGYTDVRERLRDLDAEGVDKEFLFTGRTLALNMTGDVDLREHYFRASNQYMAEICSQAPDRLYFPAIPNYWDPAEAAASLREIKALGAKAIFIPNNPRKDIDGNTIHWPAPNMDPFWSAVEDSGLPVCFHIGEGAPNAYPGAFGAFMLLNMQGMAPIWAALTFGGVFDRHPRLRVVFAEAGIGWVPKALHDADILHNSYASVSDMPLAHHPSWYWFNHCYATFMADPPGLALLDRIGADRVMWSSDYPHPESTFGYTQSAIQAVFDATSEANARKIVGGTALELFDMA